MPLLLEVDSKPYEGFISASVRLSLDSLAHEFHFVAASQGTDFLPFKGGQSCRVFIGNTIITSGNIEIIEPDYSAGSHEINIQGRSKTGDLVDSTLDAIEINAPIPLKTVIERVISQLGASITVADQSGIDPFDQNEDRLGAEIGQNAFDYIAILARKRQVLLTTDSSGNVLITRSTTTDSGGSLINQIEGRNNNILSASISYDHSNRFNKYIVKSQLNVSSLIFGGGVTDLNSIVGQGGDSITDDDVRTGRQLVIKAEKASSTEQATLRATWEANIRRVRSGTYNAVVQGFADNNDNLWTLNTTVQVIDEFADINAKKLINNIEFSTTNNGDITRLNLVEPDAYQVSLEEPQETEESGENLFDFS